jgi:RimJ/RimL family protein N-acetyltransferase
MDNHAADTEVLSRECVTDTGDILKHGQWTVREMILSLEKIRWLWTECNKYRSLFSDFTRGHVDNFVALLMNGGTFWMEVVNEQGTIVGVIYLTDLRQIIDYGVHIIFFDCKLSEKVPLCKVVAKWIFDEFPCHRLTAIIPGKYYTTLRFIRKLGFVEEGRKRQSQLMSSRWDDEVIFGLLRSEVA